MSGERLNILQVTPFFYPAWAYGGVPRVVYELSRELARRGHSVSVCTTDVLDAGHRYLAPSDPVELEGMEVHYFRNRSNSLAFNHQLFAPVGMKGFLRTSGAAFDVIHMHAHRHLLNNLARSCALKHGKPYVLSGHGTILRIERKERTKAVFDLFLGDKVLRDASAFIAVSHAEIKQYEGMGVAGSRCRVIYNGIDASAFSRLPGPGRFRERHGLNDKKIILFLGKITPRKGIDFLARTFAGLDVKRSVLVIAGSEIGFSGSVKERIEGIIQDRSVSDRVLYTGFLDGDEKLSAYRDADVLVYPAVHEIFGLVPLEAILCGTPAIVTDGCGCGEIFRGREMGYLIKYGDVDGFRATLIDVLSNPADAEAKVAAGREFIIKELTWASAAKAHEEVYRDVISEKGA